MLGNRQSWRVAPSVTKWTLKALQSLTSLVPVSSQETLDMGPRSPLALTLRSVTRL